MKKEELQAKFQEIGSLEDVADIRAKLVDFQKDLETDYDTHDQTSKSLEETIAKNKKLQENNMALYLQITNKEEEKGKKVEEHKPRRYEDLFNEKGGLK